MLPIEPISPAPHFRRKRPEGFNAPTPSDPVSEQRRAVERLAEIQRSRPLVPPHRRGKR